MLSLLILEKFLPTLCKDDSNVIAFNNFEQLRLVKVDGHKRQSVCEPCLKFVVNKQS